MSVYSYLTHKIKGTKMNVLTRTSQKWQKIHGLSALKQERLKNIIIKPLDSTNLQAYKALRLRALQLSPLSFGSNFAEENAYSDAVWLQRIEAVGSNVVFGAFEGDALVGTAGVFMHSRLSERHRGTLWGVYVAPEARGLKLGEQLVQAIIDHAVKRFLILDAKVVATNNYARKVYEKLGFVTYGLEKKSLYIQGQFLDQELIAIDFTEPQWASKRD